MVPPMTNLSIRRLFGRHAGGELGHLIGLLQEWWNVSRQRRALASLDDWTLKDIGVTRSDVEFESTKPFWRR